jgi:hypothetical protein
MIGMRYSGIRVIDVVVVGRLEVPVVVIEGIDVCVGRLGRSNRRL